MGKSKHFKSKEEYVEVMNALFTQLQRNEVGKSLADSKMSIRFEYKDPDCSVTMDASGKPKEEGTYGDLLWNDTSVKPDVTMISSADYSLRFWQGKENAVMSITLGKLKAKGDVGKALALLPKIKPAYKLFPKILSDMGRKDLIVKR